VLPCVCLRIDNNIFLGYGTCKPDPSAVNNIDYKLALKTMENELASLFEVFFTGNSFFHYYQAKTSSLWALASFIGICFVGVATAIPVGKTRTTNNHISIGVDGCTKVVRTMTTDLVMAFFVLVSLGLLQSMHYSVLDTKLGESRHCLLLCQEP
jgi:hypothetical protein